MLVGDERARCESGGSSCARVFDILCERGEQDRSLVRFRGRPAAPGTAFYVPVVPAYQRTSRFVWAYSLKSEVLGTYQKIPGTGHLEPSIL